MQLQKFLNHIFNEISTIKESGELSFYAMKLEWDFLIINIFL